MMLRDFFVPDNVGKPPTNQREQNGMVYESADLSADWLPRFVDKFQQPAIGYKKGSKIWQKRAVNAWRQVAQEWQSLQFPAAEALLTALEATTGLSRKMLEEAVRNHFSDIDENSLRGWLMRVRQDRGPRDLPFTTTYPELVFLIAAGNIPGVAIHPVVQLSLLGIPTLVKNASAEPFLLPAILASLARHDPHVAARIAALTWSRKAAELTDTILAFHPQLVAFGDDETIMHFQEHSDRLADPKRPLTGFGDRFSLALVSPGVVEPKLLHGLAYDICMYEQMGCLSPQAVLLLTDKWEGVERFCRELAEALSQMSEQLPIGRRTPAQQSAIQQWRGALAARRAAGEKVLLLTSEGTEWTVVAAGRFDLDERVACRFARVWPIPSLKRVMSILHQYELQLQALATSLTLEETEILFPQFMDVGSPFIHILDTYPGLMQKPVFGWLDQNRAWLNLTRAFIEW